MSDALGLYLDIIFDEERINKSTQKLIKRLEDNSQLKLGIDEKSLSKFHEFVRLSEGMAKTNIKFDMTGTATEKIRTLEVGMGRVLNIMERFNPKTEEWEKNFSLVVDRNKENQEAMNNINSMLSEMVKRQKEMLNATGDRAIELRKEYDALKSSIGMEQLKLTTYEAIEESMKKIDKSLGIQERYSETQKRDAQEYLNIQKKIVDAKIESLKTGDLGEFYDKEALEKYIEKLNEIKTFSPKQVKKEIEDLNKEFSNIEFKASVDKSKIDEVASVMETIKKKEIERSNALGVNKIYIEREIEDLRKQVDYETKSIESSELRKKARAEIKQQEKEITAALERQADIADEILQKEKKRIRGNISDFTSSSVGTFADDGSLEVLQARLNSITAISQKQVKEEVSKIIEEFNRIKKEAKIEKGTFDEIVSTLNAIEKKDEQILKSSGNKKAALKEQKEELIRQLSVQTSQIKSEKTLLAIGQQHVKVSKDLANATKMEQAAAQDLLEKQQNILKDKVDGFKFSDLYDFSDTKELDEFLKKLYSIDAVTTTQVSKEIEKLKSKFKSIEDSAKFEKSMYQDALSVMDDIAKKEKEINDATGERQNILKEEKQELERLLTQKTNLIASEQTRLRLADEINAKQQEINVQNRKEQADANSLIELEQKRLKLKLQNISQGKNAEYINPQQLAALERAIETLEAISTKQARAEIDKLKLAIEELGSDANTKRILETSNAIKLLTQRLNDMGIYATIDLGDIFNFTKDTISKGVDYIKELDEAYTDVAISMDISRKEFQAWTKQAREIAQANGQMTTSAMDMVKIYATAGEDISAIQDKLSGTLAIQNITQWSAEQTTSAVNSIVNQYKLLEKEINGSTQNVSGAIEYIGNALVKISNELTVDNVRGIQEMVNAIDTAGSVMEQSGASMEYFMAITGTLNEAMNVTGSEVGNAFKFISARVFAQAQALEDLGESYEDVELEALKAERALNSVGVAVREAHDPSQLRSIEDILGDLHKKWDGLSDVTKNFIAEGVAGVNRRNFFLTTMENYDRVLELTNSGMEAHGALAEANAERVDSLAGRTDVLKDKFVSLMEGLSPVLYGLVDLGNATLDFVNWFGKIPTVVSLATASFMNLTDSGKELRANFIDMLPSFSSLIDGLEKQKVAYVELLESKKLVIGRLREMMDSMKSAGMSTTTLNSNLRVQQKELIRTQAQIALTTIKTVALQTAMSVGLSIAIGAAISAISKLGTSLANSIPNLDNVKSKISDLTNAVSEYSNASKNLNELKQDIPEMERMLKVINDENTSLSVKESLQKSINELLSEHGANYSSIKGILDDENVSLETKIQLLERQAELEEQLAQKEVFDSLNDKNLFGQTSYQQMAKSVDSYVNKIKTAFVDIELISKLNPTSQWDIDRNNKKLEELNLKISNIKTEMNGVATQALIFKSNIESLFSSGFIDKTQFDYLMTYYDQTMQGLQEASEKYDLGLTLEIKTSEENVDNTIEETETKVKSVQEKLQSLFNSKYDTTNVTKAFNDIQKACGMIGDNSQDAKLALEEIKKQFPEMGDSIETLSQAMEYLGTKSILETKAEAEKLIDIINSLGEKGSEALSTSTMQELLSMYPELASHITDATYIQDFLNEKVKEMEDAQDQAYTSMLKNDEEFWNTKVKNSQEFIDYQKKANDEIVAMGAESLGIQASDFAKYIDEKGLMRDVDLSNAKTLAEAESATEAQKLTDMMKAYSMYLKDKGIARSAESDEILGFLNWQGVTEAKTIDELKKLWLEYYNAKNQELINSMNQISALAGDYGDVGNISAEQMEQFRELQKRKEALEKLNQQMQSGSLFNQINTTFKGSSSAFRPSSYGTGGSSSSSSSNSSKEVADLDLQIDRYYKLNDALDDVNNKLEENRKLQDNASTVKEMNQLLKEETRLLNEKTQALQNLLKEQQKEANELRDSLRNNGFTFDSDGNITNYASRLEQIQNSANKLSGEAKENAISHANAIVEMINNYTTLTNSSIPSVKNQILEMNSALDEVRKTQEELAKGVERLGERYYNVLQAIKKVDNQLAMIDAKKENATASERVELLNKEIELLKEKQKLLKQQQSETVVEVDELYKDLLKQGVEFNTDGTIRNYDQLMKKLQDKASSLVGTSRQDELDKANELISLIEKYDELVKDILPSLGVEWVELNNDIISLEKSKLETIASMEKQITNAITSELQKRTDETKKELSKQKELYLDQYEEEDYQNELAKEQRKLDEIQQQINMMMRDSSLAGQLKLKDLLQQYEEQQENISNIIRDWEKQQSSERFDEEMERLDEELENMLDPENMAQMVAEALKSGFVTIGDEIINLDKLMADFAIESEGAITALSNTIRSEMIDSLEETKQLVQELGAEYHALVGMNEKLTEQRNALSGEGSINQKSVDSVPGDVSRSGSFRLYEALQEEMMGVIGDAANAIKELGKDLLPLSGYGELLSNVKSGLENLKLKENSSIIEFNAPLLNIEGDISQDIEGRLQDFAIQVQDSVTNTISRALSTI